MLNFDNVKATEIIDRSTGPFPTLEFVPPLRGGDINRLYEALAPLVEFGVQLVNITSHCDEAECRTRADGTTAMRRLTRRPGTVAIAAALMKRFPVEVVPHLICAGASPYEIENDLIDLSFLDIHNVMALRGDSKPGKTSGRTFAYPHCDELVGQITRLNRGRYLDEDIVDATPTDFCIGVAGYPEKHSEAPDTDADIANLRRKVEAGAHYIVTQMFFDNRHFYDFETRCRRAGITVPIIPGLKPVSTETHLTKLPEIFSLEMPAKLKSEALRCRTPHDYYELGIEWCTSQSRDLLAHGVPAIHYYTMGRPDNIRRILKAVF